MGADKSKATTFTPAQGSPHPTKLPLSALPTRSSTLHVSTWLTSLFCLLEYDRYGMFPLILATLIYEVAFSHFLLPLWQILLR